MLLSEGGRKKSHFRNVQIAKDWREKSLLAHRRMSCDELIQYQEGFGFCFRMKMRLHWREHWYWTSLTTRRDFFLSFAILNLLQIEFLFIFKFSNFRFFLSRSLPRTHATLHQNIYQREKTFQNDHQNEQQGHSIQIPLPLHLDTSNRTNHVPLNSTSIAVSAADSRSMILSLENNVNVVSNIIRDSENLVKIKCGQCRKVSWLPVN